MLDQIRALSAPVRHGLLLALAGTLAAVILAQGPLAQDQQFHHFADTAAFGIAHFGNVVSNLPYLIVGLFGFWAMRRRADARADWRQAAPFAALFTGFVLVTFGSAYYHADPTDATLAWDRAAMTVIFGGGLAAFLADRLTLRRATIPLLAIALALGLLSIVVWQMTGDLRLYRIDQALTMAPALASAVLFRGRLTHLGLGTAMLALFGGATVCEVFDHEIAYLLGGHTTGHVIKHLLAAAAGLPAVAMILRAPPAK